MGCVTSTLLSRDDEFVPQLGTASSALGHHIVRLTSSSYGLLSLEPTVTPLTSHPTPGPSFALSDPRLLPPAPEEVINSWDLMEGLDADDSFRFSPLPCKTTLSVHPFLKENSNPNIMNDRRASPNKCAPDDRDGVVMYTTTLRGVRKTFEDCNAVRTVLSGFGVAVCEKDVSMDIGFREELKGLMKDNGGKITLPRVFVRGKDVGGAEEVARMAEEGELGKLLDGMPKRKAGESLICDGCGNVRFVPCFRCSGSCKVTSAEDKGKSVVVARCGDCNENGLVLCPLCSRVRQSVGGRGLQIV